MKLKGKQSSKYFWIDNILIKMSPIDRVRFVTLMHFETDIDPFIIQNILYLCKQGNNNQWINNGFVTLDNCDINHFINFLNKSHGKFKKSGVIDIIHPPSSRVSMKNFKSGGGIYPLLPRRQQLGAGSMRKIPVYRNGSGVGN
jgi:hypothetical protein